MLIQFQRNKKFYLHWLIYIYFLLQLFVFSSNEFRKCIQSLTSQNQQFIANFFFIFYLIYVSFTRREIALKGCVVSLSPDIKLRLDMAPTTQ